MQEQEVKWIQTGKMEVKLSLFVDRIILYAGEPENSTKSKKLMGEFCSVALSVQ